MTTLVDELRPMMVDMPDVRGGADRPTGGSFANTTIRRAVDEATQGPDAKAAAITRQQWDHFRQFYGPLETRAIREAMRTDFSAEADEASLGVRAASAAGQGMTARSVRRARGSGLTAEERQAVERRRAIQMTSSSANVENRTRRDLSESRQQLLANIVGIGRGVQQTASSGLAGAANLATQRQMQYDAQRSAYRQSQMATLGSAAALLLSL